MAKLSPLNILSPISNLFKSGKNPHAEALPYLNAIPQFGREAYNPFIQQGQAAQSQLPGYGQMAQNPQDYLAKILGGYQESPGYKYQENKLQQLAHNTAAAGGYAGTGGDIAARQEGIQGLLGQDMQQYLANVLGIQGMGAEGLENQVGRGYHAAGSLADYLGGSYGQLAGSAFQGRAQQNANKQAFLNALLQAGATGAGAYFGGPAGAAMAGGMAGGGGTGGGNIGGYGAESLFGRYQNPGGGFRSLQSIGVR